MDLKILENKLVSSCLYDNKNIEDILRIFSLKDFTGECKEILTILKKDFDNNFKTDLDEFPEVLKNYIFEALEKEYSSMNFDKYMSNFYEELRKSKLKDSLKGFKEDDFDTIKNKVNRVFEENTNVFESKQTSLEDAFNEFYEEAEKENFKEINLGFNGLMEHCTFEEGDVVLIAGNTGLGKTAFALDMILRSIKQGNHKILFVSLEMATSQVIARLISNMARIELWKLKKKNRKHLTDKEWGSIGVVQGKIINNLDIFDSSNTDINFITNKVKEMDKIKDYDYIVIDYLQLLRAEGQNRTQQITNASLRVKQLARELKKTVVALAQLNRNNTGRADKRPELTDLKDSSQLEQECSIGILLHSDEYHDKENKSNDIIEVTAFIDKNRTGKLGNFDLHYNKIFQAFEEK